MSGRNPDDVRHEDCGREEPDDAEPFEEQARDTIETPPVCSVCGVAVCLDDTCDPTFGDAIYCEPCHDEAFPQ